MEVLLRMSVEALEGGAVVPSRVIRSDVLSSRSLSRVSWEADWLWMKLLLAADEFGRLDGRPEVIRAECFPTRPQLTLEQLEKWLTELSTCDPGGSGPLIRYEVDGWPYLQLANWEKHRAKRNRAESSKFPDPPGISAELRKIPRNEKEDVGSGSGGPGVNGSRGQGFTVGPSDPPAGRRRAGGPVKSPAPERLSAEQWERLVSWAAEKEPWAVPRLEELSESCLGHFRASGKPMVDWCLVVQNWVRNERTRFGRVNGGVNGHARKIGPIEAAARNIAARMSGGGGASPHAGQAVLDLSPSPRRGDGDGRVPR